MQRHGGSVNITRLLALIRKEFIQIIRDPRTLTIIFIMPLLQLLLMGFSATSDVRNVPLAVLDRGSLARRARSAGGLSRGRLLPYRLTT